MRRASAATRPDGAGRDQREPLPQRGLPDERTPRPRAPTDDDAHEQRRVAEPYRARAACTPAPEGGRVDAADLVGMRVDRARGRASPASPAPRSPAPAGRCSRPTRRPRCGRDRPRSPPDLLAMQLAEPPRSEPLSGYTIRAASSDRARRRSCVERFPDDGRRAPRPGVSRSRRPRARTQGHALVTLDGRYAHRRAHRVRRHGRGLPRPRHRARPRGRDQGAAPLARRRPGVRRSLPHARRARRQALSHPNIVAVFDWGSVDGIYYMVMEYVHGQSRARTAEPRGRACARAGSRRRAPDACSRSSTRTARASCTAT